MYIIKFCISITIIPCLFACVQSEKNNHSEKNKLTLSDAKTTDSIACEYSPKYSTKTRSVSFCRHYLSGKLIRDGLFLNEKTPLSYHYFYDSIGGVKTIKEFRLIDEDSSIVNNFIEFDSDGDTLYSKSNFYKIKLLQDTIFTNQPIDLEVILEPFYTTSKAEVTIEELTHPDSILIAPLDNFRTQLTLSPVDSAGRYKIRGLIREVNLDSEGDSIVRDLWITHFVSIYD
jgi:hypothetical protein